MKIQPLRDRVLIKPISKEEKTESGILIPETAEEKKPEQGKVVAVGSGRKTTSGNTIPLEVEKGDKVLYNEYGPSEVKIEGNKFLIAREKDILGIIK